MSIEDIFTLISGLAIALGVGISTIQELLIIRALKDGRIDASEQTLLGAVAASMRVVFQAFFFSGTTFLLYEKLAGNPEVLWNQTVWSMSIIFLVLGVTILLRDGRRIPFEIGSSVITVSWYTLFILGLFGKTLSAPLDTIMVFYFLSILLGTFIIDRIQRLAGIYM